VKEGCIVDDSTKTGSQQDAAEGRDGQAAERAEGMVPAGELAAVDPEIQELIGYEAERQQRKLIMIASESICPPAVREALASEFSHIYAEGYPSPRTLDEPPQLLESYAYQLAAYRRLGNRRYYKGCEYVDHLEQLCRRRTAEVFANELESADDIFVNVQPLSGAAANNAVYNAFVDPGDTVMGPSLVHGGHLTHGSEVNRSGMNHRVVSYEIARSGQLDYDAIEKLAEQARPRLIIGGFSAYPWDINWARMRSIADRVGAVLLADIAHLAGLVAAGLLNSPVGHAHVISFTTHKTMCGPRGAMLLSTDPEIAKKIDMGVFPGEQGGPHIHVLAAKAVAMRIAAGEDFRRLQHGVQTNARALAEGFEEHGLRLAYGGTNTHMCLVDLRRVQCATGMPLSGEVASRLLDMCGIVCNKNTIFGDTNATHPSGLRFGTTWVTQRGLGPAHMKRLAGLVAEALCNIHPFGYMGGQIDLGRGKKSRDLIDTIAKGVGEIVAEAAPEPSWHPEGPPSGYPHFAPPEHAGLRQTALAPLHKSQAVAMTEKDGYEVPAHFGDPERERSALASGAALTDSGGELLVEVSRGRAAQLLECACASRVLELESGQAVPTLLLHAQGEPIARALVLRLEPDDLGERYLIKVRAAQADRVLAWLRDLSDGYVLHDDDIWLKAEGPAVIEDMARPSDERAPMTCLGLRGPGADDVIGPVFGIQVPGWGRAAEAEGCLVLNRPQGTVPGFELFVPVPQATRIWSRLIEAGAQPTGYEALAATFAERQPEPERGDGRVDLSKPFFIGQKPLLTEAEPVQPPPAFTFEPPEDEALKKTCLFAEHEKLCKPKQLVPFAGWQMPVMYAGILDEHRAVRESAGLFDVSHMGLLEFSGPQAERFLDLVTSNYVPLLLPGQAHYSYLLAHDGRCIDDIIVYRLARERFMVVVNAANADEDEAWLRAVAAGEVLLDPANPRARIGGEVHIRDLKDPALCGEQARVDLAFQGPQTLAVMGKLIESRSFLLGIERLRPFELCSGRLAGKDVTVARTGYTGEALGYEVFVHPEHAPELWNALLEAGRTYGVQPCGLGARDSLRTEAGFPLHGHELAGPHAISPIESGYGKYVKLHKPFFAGRAAMLDGYRKRERRVVRFEVDGKGGKVLRPGNPVLAGRKNEYAGVVTSATSTGQRQVGLALLAAKAAREGAKLQVLPVAEGDRQPPARAPLELDRGDWMVIPRQATILPRFMAPGEQPLD
jgi:glycine cleavage system T protein